jgi:hypothetical protein
MPSSDRLEGEYDGQQLRHPLCSTPGIVTVAQEETIFEPIWFADEPLSR